MGKKKKEKKRQTTRSGYWGSHQKKNAMAVITKLDHHAFFLFETQAWQRSKHSKENLLRWRGSIL